MRSRVKKNQDLYIDINSNAESSVENSNLSSFAQQLNNIDSQFETLKTSTIQVNEARRAKDSTEATVGFETYENEYLNDFLEEVKSYNVQKGYRSEGNTQTHIINELRSNPGSAYKEAIFSEEVLSKNEPKIEETQIYSQVDTSEFPSVKHTQAQTVSSYSNPSIEETISMAISDMDIYDASPTVEEAYEYVEVSSQREEQLLEETMTLKHKIVEQEEEISTLQTEKDKTGQLLNITIVLLIFTIIVLGVIIIINMMN